MSRSMMTLVLAAIASLVCCVSAAPCHKEDLLINVFSSVDSDPNQIRMEYWDATTNSSLNVSRSSPIHINTTEDEHHIMVERSIITTDNLDSFDLAAINTSTVFVPHVKRKREGKQGYAKHFVKPVKPAANTSTSVKPDAATTKMPPTTIATTDSTWFQKEKQFLINLGHGIEDITHYTYGGIQNFTHYTYGGIQNITRYTYGALLTPLSFVSKNVTNTTMSE